MPGERHDRAPSGGRLDLRHADAIGVNPDESSEGTSGQTWLRRCQFTDLTQACIGYAAAFNVYAQA